MARVPSFDKAFAGRWRIVEMDVWDNDFLDLIEEAHLTFKGAADGEIAFGALKGFLDVRYGARDGSACAEFSWEGHDENDPACGRGWVVFGTAGRLVGHFYIHNALESLLRSSFVSARCPDSLSAGNTHSLACNGYISPPNRIARARHRIISRDKGISKARLLPPFGLVTCNVRLRKSM